MLKEYEILDTLIVSTTYTNMGIAFHTQGQLDKAMEVYQRSLQIFKKTVGREHPSTVTVAQLISRIKK